MITITEFPQLRSPPPFFTNLSKLVFFLWWFLLLKFIAKSSSYILDMVQVACTILLTLATLSAAAPSAVRGSAIEARWADARSGQSRRDVIQYARNFPNHFRDKAYGDMDHAPEEKERGITISHHKHRRSEEARQRLHRRTKSKSTPKHSVGIIGHIDHGKTSLTSPITKVLTSPGSSTHYDQIDNAPEEKERGITISHRKHRRSVDVGQYLHRRTKPDSKPSIGTIGHIDHGKTTLTSPMTMFLTDGPSSTLIISNHQTDNTPEEKGRSTTISHHKHRRNGPLH